MHKPIPDGYMVIDSFAWNYNDSSMQYVQQPHRERLKFADGWTRKETCSGLKIWKLREYQTEGERHTYRTYPWHTVLHMEVVCNSEEYIARYNEWLEQDHKLGHPDGKPSFQCQGCFEEQVATYKGRIIELPRPLYTGWDESDLDV